MYRLYTMTRRERKATRDATHVDYRRRLSPAEREWLAQFDRAWAYGSPASTDDSADRRASYGRKNRARRDAWNWADPVGEGDMVALLGADTDATPAPLPTYLATARYRAALAHYRECIDRVSARDTLANRAALDAAGLRLAAAAKQTDRQLAPKPGN